MKHLSITLVLILLALTHAHADATAPVVGDASHGQTLFRVCQACHVVRGPQGEVLAGRNAATGPNLYGVAGSAAGSVAGYAYSSGLHAAGRAGLIWDQSNFSQFTTDPTGFLAGYLDDPKARSKMVIKVRSNADAADLYAYLKSLSD
ncbi:cytochrome c family protein [Pseudoruegeria sp. SK021]|uniref:c-type cytochrome n=1 Tax=Pseudoruegeria sp. SK021 TaxID=1933035 RepID=UPI000A2644CC|nr:c-type cytochrome [Pseudoruegeria sp. SK021]OSP55401.1 hypothetical protein BV911_08185 [Pseudoruegeria sp. SK021]